MKQIQRKADDRLSCSREAERRRLLPGGSQFQAQFPWELAEIHLNGISIFLQTLFKLAWISFPCKQQSFDWRCTPYITTLKGLPWKEALVSPFEAWPKVTMKSMPNGLYGWNGPFLSQVLHQKTKPPLISGRSVFRLNAQWYLKREFGDLSFKKTNPNSGFSVSYRWQVHYSNLLWLLIWRIPVLGIVCFPRWETNTFLKTSSSLNTP